MSRFDWESFLKRWSQEIINAIGDDRTDLPPEVLKSGWLGYPGATEQQITRAEARLGTPLPPSYQAFLKVTNGWRRTPLFSNRLWSIEDTEWFSVKHQGWIDAFREKADREKADQPASQPANAKAPPLSIADAEYLIYGDAQDCSKIRVEYLQTALAISDRSDGAIYLLNPQIVTPEGEWEAWFFGDWLPGADRYRSFQEMMQAEYESFLELRDPPANPALQNLEPENIPPPSPAAPAVIAPAVIAPAVIAPVTPAAIPEVVPELAGPGPSAPSAQAPWHALASFTVEFQTRPGQGRDEHRSIVCHRETNTVATRSDLDTTALHQWMLRQIKDHRHPPRGAAVGVEVTQLRVLRASPSAPPLVVTSAQPLFADPLQQGEPFTLEVSINMVGAVTAPQLDQPVVCRAQGVAHHLSTRADTDLGAITTHFIGGHHPTHTAQLPEAQLLLPGLYRLKVWVTLQNIVAFPGYFKVPMLLVV